MGVEENGGGPHQAAHLFRPTQGVSLDLLHGAAGQIDVPPGVGPKGPAGLLQPGDDGLYRVNFRLAALVKGGAGRIGLGDVNVILGAVAQDALIAGKGIDRFCPVEGKIGVFQHEFVQNCGGVQVLGQKGLLGIGVGALGPDLPVLSQHQLGGKALVEHILIVVHIVKGDDQGLFPLWEHQGVAYHAQFPVGIGLLGPHVLHAHENVALVIDALENLIVLVYRHHPVVQSLLFRAAGGAVVERPLGIGDDRVEKQVLHGLFRPPGLGQLVLAPIGAHRVVGVNGRRGGCGNRRHRHKALVRSGGGGGRRFAACAGGQGEAQGQRERQRPGAFETENHCYQSSKSVFFCKMATQSPLELQGEGERCGRRATEAEQALS